MSLNSKSSFEMPKTRDVKHLGIKIEEESIWRENGPLGTFIATFSFVFLIFALFWVVPTFAPAWDHLMVQHHIIKH